MPCTVITPAHSFILLIAEGNANRNDGCSQEDGWGGVQAGGAKLVANAGTLFHRMLTELAHHCNFDSRESVSRGSAEGRLLVTWMGTTSWQHCSHLFTFLTFMDPGDWELTSPTPGTSPVPPRQVPASSSSHNTACQGTPYPHTLTCG